MSHLYARTAGRFMLALLLSAPTPLFAQAFPIGYPRCDAVYRFADGSWQAKLPLMFGRTVKVGAGAIIYKGTVFAGIDLGAVLERTCNPPIYPPPLVRF